MGFLGLTFKEKVSHPPPSGGCDPFEGFDHDVLVDLGRHIGILGGPRPSRLEIGELRHDETAGEAGSSGVLAIDGRVWPAEDQTPLVLKGTESRKMSGSGGEAGLQAVLVVLGDDCVEQLGDLLCRFLVFDVPSQIKGLQYNEGQGEAHHAEQLEIDPSGFPLLRLETEIE